MPVLYNCMHRVCTFFLVYSICKRKSLRFCLVQNRRYPVSVLCDYFLTTYRQTTLGVPFLAVKQFSLFLGHRFDESKLRCGVQFCESAFTLLECFTLFSWLLPPPCLQSKQQGIWFFWRSVLLNPSSPMYIVLTQSSL